AISRRKRAAPRVDEEMKGRAGMFRTATIPGALLIVAIEATVPAAAQTAPGDAANAPDKSSYSLLSPTPDDQLRSFCTDRPPKANLPCTVDAGRFQYESDAFNWTRAV